MKLVKVFSVVAVLLALAAGSVFAKKAKPEVRKLKVVTTIFPEYDWTREVVGEKMDAVELTLLLNNGVDLHSYSPSVRDIAKISEADIFVYVGGESDGWVGDVLKSAKNRGMKVINLLEVLGDRVKAEEVVEGMEHEHDHEHGDAHHHHDDDHDHDAHHHEHEHEHGDAHHHHDDDHDHEAHHHDDEDEDEKDEHVWLSLRCAKLLCGEICAALCEKDSANAAAYRKNLADYSAKLDALDAKYADAVKNARVKTLVFGDRFPFRYLVDDYGLRYFAAFPGCSAESEASFSTILFLSGKVDELGLNAVCQIESGNGKIAKTVISSGKSKKASVVTFDSLQSTTTRQAKKGVTYLNTMEKNLEALREALK